MLLDYCESVAGGLDFSYCDVAADFIGSAYPLTREIGTRKALFTRLWAIGGYHNRFHVGSVVAGLIASADGPDAQMISDVIRTEGNYADFYWSYVKTGRRASVVETAFKQARGKE